MKLLVAWPGDTWQTFELSPGMYSLSFIFNIMKVPFTAESEFLTMMNDRINVTAYVYP